MKKWILWLIVTELPLLFITNGYATTERVRPVYQRNCSEFERIQRNVPDLILLKGEIVGINREGISVQPLTVDNGIYQLKLAQNTKFFCNGIPSQWEALKPVAADAYFEAQLLVNREKTEVIAVNAYYYGEECVIKNCFRNQGKLTVELVSVHSEATFSYPVNQAARLPAGENWRREGQVVYILFNCQEEIRAVFLPD